MADVRSRIALLVEAQGARRAATDLRGVEKGVDKLGTASQRSGRHMRTAQGAAAALHRELHTLGTTAKLGALAVGGLAFTIGKGAITEWREALVTGRQTNAVIKSTGGISNVTAKQVGNLANALSLKAGIDDEVIQGGENLLLTFRNVRNEVGKGNDVFTHATKTAVDMSAAFHQGVNPSMIQLGKALDDPIKGVTALRRIGVSFTEQQRAQIKTLVQHNHLLAAQRFILRAVDAQVKGSAAAQADPLMRLQVAWKNLEERIGFALAPAVTKAANLATRIANVLSGRGGMESKLHRISNIGKPIVTSLVAGFNQNLPRLADAVGSHAPRVAQAFLKGFQNAGVWGKVTIAAILLKKTGGLGALAKTGGFLGSKIAGRLLGRGGGGALGGLAGRAGAVPVFVTNEGFGGGAAVGGKGGKGGFAKFLAFGGPEALAVAGAPFLAHALGADTGPADLASRQAGIWKRYQQSLKGAHREADSFAHDPWGGFLGHTLQNLGATVADQKANMRSNLRGIRTTFSSTFGAIGDILTGFQQRISSVNNTVGTAILGVQSALQGLPGAANGGRVMRGGRVMVGERGPEVLNLPAGARVAPLPAINPIGGGSIRFEIPVVIDGKQIALAVRKVALKDLLNASAA